LTVGQKNERKKKKKKHIPLASGIVLGNGLAAGIKEPVRAQGKMTEG